MTSDIRVILIKFADRLHNLRTLEFLSTSKQLRLAQETLEIYAPLADRLGMGHMKRELEDLAFPAIDSDAYQHAVEVRKLKTKETEAGRARVQKDIRHDLARKNSKNLRT